MPKAMEAYVLVSNAGIVAIYAPLRLKKMKLKKSFSGVFVKSGQDQLSKVARISFQRILHAQ